MKIDNMAVLLVAMFLAAFSFVYTHLWIGILSAGVFMWILGESISPIMRRRRLTHEFGDVMIRITLAIHDGKVVSNDFTTYIEGAAKHLSENPPSVHLHTTYAIDRSKKGDTLSIEHHHGSGRTWSTTQDFWLIFYIEVGREFCRIHNIP